MELERRHSLFKNTSDTKVSFLPEISSFAKEEEEEQEDGSKYMKFSPGQTTVTLISPDKKSKMRIKNVSVPITTNALRFQELQHI